MNGFRLLNLLCIVLLGGCYIEPFSEPVPVPANYSVAPVVHATPQPMATTLPSPATTHAAPVATGPIVLDGPARTAVGDAVRELLLKRYTLDKAPELNQYLMLVGSLVALGNPDSQIDYQFVLLDTNDTVSFGIHPATIAISKGLVQQMEDESELAGVIAREIANLQAGRAFKALGYAEQPTTRATIANPTTPVTLAPTTRPTTQAAADPAIVGSAAPKLAAILEKQSFGTELDRQADLEGARLAAAARYAPDGYLRLLTRQKADWRRIEALDAAVQIVAKAHPHADVRLPARFEQYLPSRK